MEGIYDFNKDYGHRAQNSEICINTLASNGCCCSNTSCSKPVTPSVIRKSSEESLPNEAPPHTV
uniref:Uncharacterized protein n=1 Tax=Anguilla anguilla TaxID=7936 RepID=A0A0E9W2X1_ANGAN